MATKRPANTKGNDEHKSKILKVGMTMNQVWHAMRIDYESMEKDNKKLKVELESMKKKALSTQLTSAEYFRTVAQQQETLRQWEGKFAVQEKMLGKARAESENLRKQNETLLKRDQAAQQALFAMDKFGKAFTDLCQDNVTVLESFLKESSIVLAKNDGEEARDGNEKGPNDGEGAEF